MNSSISTNEDLLKFAEEMALFQILQTTRVLTAVQDFPSKKLLSSWFQQRKYQKVTQFDKGNDLIRSIAESKDKALVIYDLEMPDRNGLEMLAVLRKFPDGGKNTTVVLCAANLNWQAKEKLLQNGVAAILAKPFTSDQLAECIKELKLPV